MNHYLALLTVFLTLQTGYCQSFRADTTFFFPKQTELHNLSGIGYVPSIAQTGLWHLVGDKGEHFTLTDLTQPQQAVRLPDTGLRMEALRYDAPSRTFFGAVEDDKVTKTSFAFFWPDSLTPAQTDVRSTTFDLISPLPFDNKGIEGLALGADSTIWVAPEAGWSASDSNLTNVIFHRYHWAGSGLTQKMSFVYPIDRMPRLGSSERYGGISEILSAGHNRLLVLERFYDGDQDTSYATLYEVRFDETNPTAASIKQPVFNFNTGLRGRRVDNLEGMAWGPTRNGRRTLVLISDDNGGRCPRPDGKTCQQTQLMVLSRAIE